MKEVAPPSPVIDSHTPPQTPPPHSKMPVPFARELASYLAHCVRQGRLVGAAAGEDGAASTSLEPRTHGLCNTPQYAAYAWHEAPVPVIVASGPPIT